MGKITEKGKRGVFWKFFSILAFVLLTCCSTIVLAQTKDYKLDKFFYDFNGTTNLLANEYDRIIMNVHKRSSDGKNNPNIDTDLFRDFYYRTILSSETRLVLNNQVEDNDGNGIKLYTQSHFYIENEVNQESGGHRIDYNTFHLYFADDILGKMKYIDLRFGAEAFIFISDTYANYLLEKYDIDSYETLITEEQYCMLELNIDGNTTSKVCINNVMLSNARQGIRAKQLYNNFGLIYNTPAIMKWSDLAFEFDLMSNPWASKRLLSTLNDANYSIDNCDFTFATFNSSSEQYEINSYVTKNFSSIMNDKNSTTYLILYIASLCIFAVAFFFILKLAKMTNDAVFFVFISIFIIIFITFIILNFVYSYPLYFLAPVLFLTAGIIAERKEITSGFKDAFRRKVSKVEI